MCKSRINFVQRDRVMNAKTKGSNEIQETKINETEMIMPCELLRQRETKREREREREGGREGEREREELRGREKEGVEDTDKLIAQRSKQIYKNLDMKLIL